MADKKPLTLPGYRLLLAEHEQLSKVERPRVVVGVTNAAAEGDRSENAEYIYGKKRLREIDKRLQYLSSLLGEVEIVDPSTLGGDKVCFGSIVVFVEDGSSAKRRWQIVGEGESDTKNGTISWRSPMARALLGKRVGDVVTVERPAGEIEVEVVELWFGERRIA
jgi:transcription elongation factor GreB